MKKGKFISEYSFKRIVESVDDDRIVEDLIDRKVVSVTSLSWLFSGLRASPRLLAKVASMPLLPDAIHSGYQRIRSIDDMDEQMKYAIVLEPMSKNPFSPKYLLSELAIAGVATVLLNPAIMQGDADAYIGSLVNRHINNPNTAYCILRCKHLNAGHIDRLLTDYSGAIGDLYPEVKRAIVDKHSEHSSASLQTQTQ